MNVFIHGSRVLHSGGRAAWKVECSALTDHEIVALALMLSEILPPFGTVEGVPRGGLRIAEALRKHATEGPLMIVDDVCTTGASMEEHRAGRVAIGAVLFARGPVPPWVTALWTHATAERPAA